MYDVTVLEANNCNKHVAQFSINKGIQRMKFGQLIE